MNPETSMPGLDPSDLSGVLLPAGVDHIASPGGGEPGSWQVAPSRGRGRRGWGLAPQPVQVLLGAWRVFCKTVCHCTIISFQDDAQKSSVFL